MKDREVPGVRRLLWCKGQVGARGTEAPLVREEPQKYPDVARLHQLEIQSPKPPLPLLFMPYCIYCIAPLRHGAI